MYVRRMVMGLAVGIAALASAGDKVSLRADAWFPYNGDPASDKPGYTIEIAKAVFEKAGLTLDYQTKGWTWDRSIAEARKGSIDGIIGAAKEDAPDFVFPEECIGIQVQTFFVKKGNAWRFKGIESLKAVKLGVISGYAYGDDVDAYIKANLDKPAVQVLQDDNALELNVKKLGAGRIDVIIEDGAVFHAKIAELKMSDQFEVAGDTASPKPAYITFSPAKKATSEKYAKLLSDGIKAMRASGELKKILDKYQISDWQK